MQDLNDTIAQLLHMKTKDKIEYQTQDQGTIMTHHSTALQTRKCRNKTQEHDLTKAAVMLLKDVFPNDKIPNEHNCTDRNEYFMKHNKSLCYWEKTTHDHCLYTLSLCHDAKLLAIIEFES